jgi:PAS domain S-box-containing protein
MGATSSRDGQAQTAGGSGAAPFFGIRAWLLLLVIAAILPLLVLVIINARSEVMNARKVAFERALGRAKVVANVLDNQFGSVDTLLISLAHQINPDPAAIAQNEALVKAVKEDLPPLYFNLKTYAPDGAALGSSGGLRTPVSTDRRYYREALTSPGLVVGDPLDIEGTGRWSITFMRAARGADGKPVALVGATLDLRQMRELLDTTALPPGSVITLLNERNLVLARTVDGANWVGRSVAAQPNFYPEPKRHSGTEERVSLDGTARLGGFTTCEKLPWSVYVGVPREEAYADVRAATRNALLLGAGTLAVALVVAWWLANRITRPLLQLAADARAFGGGDLKRRAAESHGGEAGVLARTFNRMLDTIEGRNEALRLSEARYRNLIDGAPEAIVVFDVESGKIVDHNPRAEALFRLDAAEMAKTSPIELSPELQPDGRSSAEAVRGHIELVRAGGTAVFEWWHRDRAGRVFPCEVRLRRLADERRLLIRGSIADITERKQAERELHATLTLQRAILNSASHTIISTNPQGLITLFNPAAGRLLGYAAAEVLGRHTPELFHDPRELAERTVEMALQDGSTPTGFEVLVARVRRGRVELEDCTYVSRSGERVAMKMAVSALHDERGSITGFLFIAADVTALRRAELQLAHERHVMEQMARGAGITEVLNQLVLGHEALFPGTVSSVMLLDPADNTLSVAAAPHLPEAYCASLDGVVIGPQAGSCGTAAATGKMVIVEDIATDPLWTDYRAAALVHGLRACWSAPIRSVQGAVLGTLAVYRHEAGGPQAHEVASIESSAQLAALAIERDHAEAERIKLERKLLETQKLESLGVLAGGIAHDFNNLLTGILGNASLASLELPEGSPIHDYLGQINQSSLRAADLCKQMLAYSGRGRFVVQKVDLNRLVEETTHLLQVSISKHAALRFNLAAGLPSIEADATQLRQVVMNLVINASEAIGGKSGMISLNTGLTRVDRAYLAGAVAAPDIAEGDYVALEVSDNGCGMEAETLAKIFDPFFSTKFTGRGLGLAAVLGIMRGHRGVLKVYSELGRGTTFKLLFPCASGPAESVGPVAAARSTWRGRGRVLVVDDEETIRSTAARMLRVLGFETEFAVHGLAAVEVLRANPGAYVLVLLDLTMPVMDGEQAFTELRRLQPDVRVVLMSGFNRQEAVARFTGKGLASFLQKPFSMEALTEVMQAVTEAK